MTQQVFKNTFAPNSENKEFTLSQIISGIKLGALKLESLPNNIQEIVKVELNKRENIDF